MIHNGNVVHVSDVAHGPLFYCNNWHIVDDFVHPLMAIIAMVCDLVLSMNAYKLNKVDMRALYDMNSKECSRSDNTI